MINRITFLVLALFLCNEMHAQPPLARADSTLTKLSSLPQKYLQTISSKANKYYSSISSKTLKTLEKLAKWEAKIKTILEKTSPETAQRLFGNGQITFASMLEKYKQGKAAADNYRGKYDEYRDKVTTTLQYLATEKEKLKSTVVTPLQQAKNKTDKLNAQLKNTDAVQEFIKSRKKALIQEAIKIGGKSKYLQKISKEAYYYGQTLQNLDEVFTTPGKAEELVVNLLKTIPAFNTFFKNNSILSSRFRSPDAGAGAASLAGLQTRTQVNNLIQSAIAAGGPNAQQQFLANTQAAQAQLNELKNKIIKAGGSSSDDELPEGFKKNDQRGKKTIQKFEYSLNVQTDKGSSVFPVSSILGGSIGYRPHQNFVAGVGFAGRIGWGKDIRHISLSYSGISATSFAEYKLKGSFNAVAGFEMNYRPEIRSLELLKDYSAWQASGLVGVSKTVSVKSKFFKKMSLKLMWDFLSYRQVPAGQNVVFRANYNF
jgi:predicted lactoylglutathione lyase